MPALCQDLLAIIARHQASFPAAMKPALVDIANQVRKCQPLAAAIWPSAQFEAAFERTRKTFASKPLIDATLPPYRAKLERDVRPPLSAARIAMTRALSKLGAAAPTSPDPATRDLSVGLFRAIQENAVADGDAGNMMAAIDTLVRQVEQARKDLAAAVASGGGGGRPGKPVKPTPRPPYKPKPGEPKPPAPTQLRSYIQMKPSPDPGRYGPAQIPSTILQSSHASLTIHVTMQNQDDAGRYPIYYERYAVPPRGTVDIGCQVPGPTMQRFNFAMIAWEL